MTVDFKIRELYYKIQAKKQEIEAIQSKPNWVTNCVFRYDNVYNLATTVINIQTVNDINTLTEIAGWLYLRELTIKAGRKKLGLPYKEYKLSWLGYTVNEWQADISIRINKINLADKKKELAVLEAKLKAILPPEFERELAQPLYSHKELQNKSCNEMQEMCFQKGHNWNDLPTSWKRGRCVVKTTYEVGDTTRSK